MNSENNIELDETFKKLNNRNVKDLYWLLFSECPINDNHPVLGNIPFFPSEILEDWKRNTTDYFLDLDQRADELKHFLNRPKNKRLGFYAEALLSFFFQTYSEVELLLQNFQIIQNTRTLGEVDFIIKWKERVIHLECAVKFYLYDHTKDVNDLHSWIGPACKDDLGRKIKKVQEHQLPIINVSDFKYFLDGKKIESYLFLKGKLFVNQEVKCDWVREDLLGRYHYLDRISDALNLKLLPKPFWMSANWEKHTSESVTDFIASTFEKRAEFVESAGLYPFFIAPKGWPFSDS